MLRLAVSSIHMQPTELESNVTLQLTTEKNKVIICIIYVKKNQWQSAQCMITRA
jgi:hypothetical protein